MREPSIDLISCLVTDELTRRGDRLLERRRKQAGFRDPLKTLDNFDFSFNKKMNRSLLFELASGNFVNRREDALFLGPPGSGKSHLAQAIGQAVIQQGHRVLYRETHALLDELAEANIGAMASAWACCRRVSSTLAMPPRRSCRRA
ncbi:MAG TPA: ATP-binding protein [Pyrinomonadaceae bacterium]|nr:ATP-binding protein [Pyrinomonadaceae bacterium]